MSEGLTRKWIVDWLGWAAPKPRNNPVGSFPPLPQALALAALFFAQAIRNNLTGLSQPPHFDYLAGLTRNHQFSYPLGSGGESAACAAWQEN